MKNRICIIELGADGHHLENYGPAEDCGTVVIVYDSRHYQNIIFKAHISNEDQSTTVISKVVIL